MMQRYLLSFVVLLVLGTMCVSSEEYVSSGNPFDLLVEVDGFLEADTKEQLNELNAATSLSRAQKDSRLDLIKKKVEVLEMRTRADNLEKRIAQLEASFGVGPRTYQVHPDASSLRQALNQLTGENKPVIRPRARPTTATATSSGGASQSTQSTQSLSAPTAPSGGCPLMTYSRGWGSVFVNKQPRIDRAFKPAMDIIHDAAVANGIKVYITSHYRAPGQRVRGAIVPPASKSNHKVGHAIDFNLQGSFGFCNGACIQRLSHSAVRNFIAQCKSAGLRWGGDWSRRDPVHLDDGLNVKSSRVYDQTYIAIGNNC